jgi:hypothetical protein
MSDQHLPELDTFDARAYLLAMPDEPAPADDAFDAREYFLMDAAEPENDCARIESAMMQAGFQDPQVFVVAQGVFTFRLRFEGDPLTYDAAVVHHRLVPALEAAGHPAWLIHIGNQLGADMLVEGDFSVHAG